MACFRLFEFAEFVDHVAVESHILRLLELNLCVKTFGILFQAVIYLSK